MDYQAIINANVAIGAVTTLVNLLFIFCLICPVQGEQIKQPLMLLLGTVVTCTTFFEISVLVEFLFHRTAWLSLISYIGFIFSLSTSMTSSAWLTFFYNTQIVPAKRAASIWIKKNIKVVIYSIWLFEKILCAFYAIVLTVVNVLFYFHAYYGPNHNSTWILYQSPFNDLSFLVHFSDSFSIVVSVHYYFCMCVMAASTTSTIVYLCKHMHRMTVNGQKVFSPQLRGQLRVTVTCVLQGVLSMLCIVWSLKKSADQGISSKAYAELQYDHFTSIHMYMAGTTLNLGAGQAVFRQRVANLWRRALCCCKTRRSDERA